ncbi:hypothetical protein B7486_59185, partial [cyanobacterium TDX16]
MAGAAAITMLTVLTAAGSASGIPLPYDPNPPLYVLQWGSGGDLDSQFSTPTGVATAPNGDVYVADRDNDRVQRFSDVGVYELQFGSMGSGNGQFRDPYGIAVDIAGNVYVSEVTNDRIQVFNADGQFITSFGGP